MGEIDRVVNDDALALPRDISRFKSLHPNGRAVIREDAEPTLGCLSSYELVGPTKPTSC